nr:ankyrin repeat-containing protein itn1 [Quercus suber]
MLRRLEVTTLVVFLETLRVHVLSTLYRYYQRLSLSSFDLRILISLLSVNRFCEKGDAKLSFYDCTRREVRMHSSTHCRRGRNALHVAAKSGMREAVQFFVERPELKGLINEQDEEGNTPMHLAAVEGYYKVLLKMAGCRDVDTNATNNESLAAMDQNWLGVELKINLKRYTKKRLKAKGGQRSLRELLKMGTWRLDPEVQDKGQVEKETGTESVDGGAGNATAIEEKGQTAKENEVKNVVSKSKEDVTGNSISKSEILRSTGETNLLVATIIATVTFTAAFTVPGVYESGDDNQGLAVLSKQAAFRVFVIANALAFGFTTASIIVYTYSANIRKGLLLTDRKRKTELALLLAYYSIVAMLIAFISGTYAVVPHSLGIFEAVLIFFCFYSGMRIFSP